MTREEAVKIAYDMGAHPYSIESMVSCLIRGAEKGAAEQKAVDEQYFKSKLKSIIKLAQDPTICNERKEMEILAMLSIIEED